MPPRKSKSRLRRSNIQDGQCMSNIPKTSLEQRSKEKGTKFKLDSKIFTDEETEPEAVPSKLNILYEKAPKIDKRRPVNVPNVLYKYALALSDLRKIDPFGELCERQQRWVHRTRITIRKYERTLGIQSKEIGSIHEEIYHIYLITIYFSRWDMTNSIIHKQREFIIQKAEIFWNLKRLFEFKNRSLLLGFLENSMKNLGINGISIVNAESQGQSLVTDHLCVALANVCEGKLKPVVKEWPLIHEEIFNILMRYFRHRKNGPAPRYDSMKTFRDFMLFQCVDNFSREFLCDCVLKIHSEFPDLNLIVLPASGLPGYNEDIEDIFSAFSTLCLLNEPEICMENVPLDKSKLPECENELEDIFASFSTLCLLNKPEISVENEPLNNPNTPLENSKSPQCEDELLDIVKNSTKEGNVSKENNLKLNQSPWKELANEADPEVSLSSGESEHECALNFEATTYKKWTPRKENKLHNPDEVNVPNALIEYEEILSYLSRMIQREKLSYHQKNLIRNTHLSIRKSKRKLGIRQNDNDSIHEQLQHILNINLYFVYLNDIENEPSDQYHKRLEIYSKASSFFGLKAESSLLKYLQNLLNGNYLAEGDSGSRTLQKFKRVSSTRFFY